MASAPGNGGGTAVTQAVTPGFAARYEAPRGSPRGSAAVSPRPMEAPVAQGETAATPVTAIASFAELIALAQEKRDIVV